ncbi:hypothetical protein M5D96_005078, partial [Drosophila gunungcola]
KSFPFGCISLNLVSRSSTVEQRVQCGHRWSF